MTVGWILEGDRDRFLAALDLTPSPAQAEPSFRCPFCKENFADCECLDAHIQVRHAVSRPFILINGTEPGAEDVIRPNPMSSVDAFNCTKILAAFDGDSVHSTSTSILAARLSGIRRGTLQLILVNDGDGLTQPIAQEYRLRVLAPDEESLRGADELFVRRLGVEGVTLERVDLFYNENRNGSAEEYARALGDYVRAVLIKDGDLRTGVSTLLHHYHEIQNSALAVLQSFDRPLPKLLCALMRFSLNDFGRYGEATGFTHLDQAYSVLGPLAQEGAEWPTADFRTQERNTRVFTCPVDSGTDVVTQLATRTLELCRWGAAEEGRFSALAERADLDSLDRVKVLALWASAALRAGDNTSARRALRLLDGDSTFGDWASDKLSEIDS